MSVIKVQGASKVEGVLIPGGNKNAALPVIAAALLTSEEVVLHNVPRILDVDAMLELARSSGVKARREADGTVKIKADIITKSVLTSKLCSKIRTSILFGAPLAVRCGSASIGLPGGDMIGRRRLDTHYYGLGKLGIESELHDSFVEFKLSSSCPFGAEMFLVESSVTATEHILMAAVLAKGTTIIRNAASEPHVQLLAYFLNSMGAKIDGIGTNTFVIRGVKSLHGTEFTIDADHIEVGSFLALAAATRGKIEIRGEIRPPYYWMMHRLFDDFNVPFRLEKNLIVMDSMRSPEMKPDAGNAIPRVSDGPWPHFPSDMMSSMIVLATQAKGTVLFFEKMFESRLYFVDKLITMGANAIVCDPHRVVITGPSRLRGIEMSSPDIRAGMALLTAGVCANGESIIGNAETIHRGYENIIAKLAALGVNISEEE